MSQSYSDLLSDPLWHKKRLEVLSYYGFKCMECVANRRTLHVHHKKYRHGAKPWEYELGEFEVLCRICHETEHVEITDEEKQIEAKISETSQRILNAPTALEKRQWFGTMSLLISKRTPDLIRKLELLKGIAK